jgi:hypothetical protein
MRRRFFTELNINEYFSIQLLADGDVKFTFDTIDRDYYSLLKYSKNNIKNWEPIEALTSSIRLNDIIYFKCTKWTVGKGWLKVETPCKIKGNLLSLCEYSIDNYTSFDSFLSGINVIEIDDSFWRNISMEHDLYAGLFRGNTYITSINIPDYITNIPRNLFSNCANLTSVTIGDSVTSIGNFAFHYCSSLTSVYCKAITPPTLTGSFVFDSNGSGRKIYVPSGSVNAYKSATNWSEYASDIIGYNF